MVISITHEDFARADLVPGAIYRAKSSAIGKGNEVISQLLPGISNSGGFRVRAGAEHPAVCVLYSTGSEGDWPDHFDEASGLFTYFGDNRKPGKDIHSTSRGGNRLLQRWFGDCASGLMQSVPLILGFEKLDSAKGNDVKFIGVLVPDVATGSVGDALVVETREHPDGSFENYRARFRVLDTGALNGDFVRESIAERVVDWEDARVPESLRDWRAIEAAESTVPNPSDAHLQERETFLERMRAARGNLFSKAASRGPESAEAASLTSNEVGARPTIESLLIYRKLTYTPWFALGEFVDNSISSFVRYRRDNPRAKGFDKLRIEIRWDPTAQVLVIEDNAAGIPFSPEGWGRALEVGSANPDPSVLSVHGYGMKAAGLWWSPAFEIESKHVDEKVSRFAELDPEALIASGRERVPIEPRTSSNPDDHWTRLTLRGLNPGRTYPQGQTLGKVRNYLASMYRSYLRGDDWSRPEGSSDAFVEIFIQGTKLEYSDPELLVAPYWPNAAGPIDSDHREWRQDFLLQVPNPRNGESSSEPAFIEVPGWAGVLAKFSRKDAGLYLSFRGKGIYGVAQGIKGVVEQYKPEMIFGAGSSFRQGRLVGEFDVSAYGKSATTDSASWSDEEEELFLRELNKALRAESMNLITMAESFRVSTAGDLSEKEAKAVQKDVDQTSREAETIVGLKHESKSFGRLNDSTAIPVLDESQTVTASEDITLPTGHKAKFRTSFASETTDWLLVYPNDEEVTEIVVNSNHPFMRRYFSGEKSVASAWQIALAIATAELDNPDVSLLRAEINRWLELAGRYEFLSQADPDDE